MSFAEFSAGAKVAVRVMALASCGLVLAGCTDTLSSFNPFSKGETYKPEIVAEVPAPELYNDGLARIQKKDYEGAAKKFSDLEKQYPYSDWSRRALIMAAYAHFEGGQYEDSITEARRYLQLHPATPDAAYAQYLLAMSHFNQIPDVTRDQEKAEKALLALQELVDRYPNSEWAPDARQRIQVARDQLAGKEMEVGRFYLQKRNYTGAIKRFRVVVALGITDEAQTAAAVLGHNFPDSPWYKDAYALLQKGGMEPRENSGSWISRAFRGIPQVGQRTG
jgi:outer membrane protein assembly factor BamD